jgi:hypothetical protein
MVRVPNDAVRMRVLDKLHPGKSYYGRERSLAEAKRVRDILSETDGIERVHECELGTLAVRDDAPPGVPEKVAKERTFTEICKDAVAAMLGAKDTDGDA